MSTRRKINTSIPSFETIIKNFVYVDKTDILYDLITSGNTYFFCSRPRRFGRTLTLSTLEAIFKGKKDLFKGLKIYDMDYDWKEYPVIHINLGSIHATNVEMLKKSLKKKVENLSIEFAVEFDKDAEYYDAWSDLIESISKKEKVVILIDEYDKILTSNLNNPQVEEMRDILWSFLEVTKSEYEYIRFVLVTGVTEFVPNSVFSSMNVLDDISMDKKYSTLFGYTQKELEYYFAEYIEKGIEKTGLSRESYLEKIRKTYGGYRFSPYQEETVYNPVLVGLFFSDGGEYFHHYWTEIGLTLCLHEITKKVTFDITDVARIIDKEVVRRFNILNMTKADKCSFPKYRALLYQYGYLTIKGIDEDSSALLVLDFPNEDVKSAYTNYLIKLAPSYKETEEQIRKDDNILTTQTY